MPICEKIQARKREVCIGDLRNQIEIYLRSLTTPEFGSVDATETFTLFASPWAALKTTRGTQFFDETNTLIEATHEWAFPYLAGIDINKWIKFQGQWYKILDVENTEERNLTLIIRCVIRGPTTKPVNEA